MSRTGSRIQLTREGLRLADETVPLLAGSVHYWRLEPEHWERCLLAIKAMGMRLVDTYIPWGVHEVRAGQLDLGAGDPRRDVAKFLRLAHRLGLYAIVRPGPHINAELTYFGLPERVVWDEACQARSPHGQPVVLPFLPRMFPVPSYASDAFLDESARYFQLLGEALKPLRYPDGPIVLLQIDNEGAMYFRDGAFDQDYHPDALSCYRAMLRRKYGTITKLRECYGAIGGDDDNDDKPLRFADIEPPRRFEATRLDQLVYYLDWAELQEQMIGRAFTRFAEVLENAGFSGVPTTHNFPLAQETTPLNAQVIGRAIDVIGYDYYNRADEQQCASVAERTTELSLRCDALNVPAFACEIGAGFPPYFPALSEEDSEFTLMTALAHGLRGYNLYMAVERDRWIGAPIDPRGRARPFAARFRHLAQAIVEAKLFSLRRRVPVRIVVPRHERRIARVMHAFGPASGALFAVMGGGVREACFEDELGLGFSLALAADGFVRGMQQALRARGVPHAVVGGEDAEVSLAGARWLVLASAGGIDEPLADALGALCGAGVRLTLGPRPLEYDSSMRPLGQLHALSKQAQLLEQPNPQQLDEAVADAISELELAAYACRPSHCYVTLFEDAAGEVQVIFVGNPSEQRNEVEATVALAGDFVDAVSGDAVTAVHGTISLHVPPRTVRMLLRRSG